MKKHSSKLARIVLTALAIVCFSVSAICFISGNAIKADAVETGTLSTAHMSIAKNEFNVGEPILVTAKVDTVGAKDWVGIVRKDRTWESIRWRYVDEVTDSSESTGFGSGAVIDVKLGQPVTKSEDYETYKNIPAGEYYVIFVKANGSASNASEMLPITVKSTAKSDSYLSVSKTDFYEGEDIVFSHNVTSPAAKDWVGITASDYTKGSIKYVYATMSKGTSVVANDMTQFALPEYQTLPAGNYNLIYVLNDGSAHQAKSVLPITIHAKLDGVKSTAHLSLEKTSFYEGEPILVTPTEQNSGGLDWIGIMENVSKGSIRWKYVSKYIASGDPTNGAGNKVQVDIRKAKVTNFYSSNSIKNIPAGIYRVAFGPNDCSGNACTEYVTIQVIKAPKPSAPSSAVLNLNNATDGYFEGKITVTFNDYDDTPSYVRASDVIMYWADEDGNKLSDYSPLAKRKISSKTTTFNTYNGVIIPTNAKKLLVYAINPAGKTSDPYVIDLPDGCQYKNDKKLIMEYNIVSDIHITVDPKNDKTRHFEEMLEDIATIAPNSQGVMVVGDIVDTANVIEYQFLVSKYKELQVKYGDDLPVLYASLGNHELLSGIDGGSGGYNVNNTDVPGDDDTQIQRWKDYITQISDVDFVKNDEAYFTNWTGGIQHIYLATEALSSRPNGAAYLSQTQLTWFENQLKANTTGNPIMIYLHQPFYNTVAGTLEPENWDEVLAGVTTSYGEDAASRYKNEKAIRDIFAKYADTKDMYMFNGHSHWYFDADRNIHVEEGMPTIFNCSSVGYLWNDYNLVEGEYEMGSQGYYVRLYEDRIEFLGRNFEKEDRNWASSAQFVVYTHTHDYQDVKTETEHYKECSCGDIIERGNHNIVSGTCTICGYVAHTHDYVAEYDETHHYQKCSCGDIINSQSHVYVDGECDCGYVDPNYQPPAGDEDEGGNVTPPPSGDGEGGSNDGEVDTDIEQQPSTDNNGSSGSAMSCAMAVGTFEGTISITLFISIMLTAFVVIKLSRKTKNN